MVNGQLVQAGTVVQNTVNAPRTPDDILADTADRLAHAVRTRWRREEEQRRVRDPFPLPVRWRVADDELTDHWANIRHKPHGVRAGPLALADRLDRVVDAYRRIPSGRLVVLGRAGSGKTVVALRLVLDLLDARTADEPVPVLVGLGSWNPTTTPLHEWLARRLVRDHPGLAAAGPFGRTLADALVEAGRVLPVLDGFDEIAPGLHRAALEALNDTTGPLVLTGRHAEYSRAVTDGDVLTCAAAVELADLEPTDLDDYLPRTTRRTGQSSTAWDPVLDAVRRDPDAPLARVLTTPLMVGLARAAYSDTPDRDPAALLAFDTTQAVEDHLLDEFLPAVYRRSGRDLDRVRHWLRHLAGRGRRDLAWWEAEACLSRACRAVIVGLVVAATTGLVMALVDLVLYGLVANGEAEPGIGSGLVNGAVNGLLVGMAFAAVAAVRADRVEPARTRFGGCGRGPGRLALSRAVLGVGIGALFGLVDGMSFGVLERWVLGVPDGLRIGLDTACASALVFGPAVGICYGLLTWSESPLDVATAVTPTDLLRTSRANVLVPLLTIGPLFGLLVMLGFRLIVVYLYRLPVAEEFSDVRSGLISGLAGGIGYALTLTAWGRWLVFGRLWLPLTGRLPWTPIAFLDDAYGRGVLRRAGAVHQFRHERLREHLARE
ncbi:NACHT domain-containing protein [Saccharothrix violaceirubra]